MNRRDFLSRSAGVTAGVALGSALGWGDLVRAAAANPEREGRSCILLFMKGGPSQMETFDPKPEHDNGGPTRAIDTAADGVRIAEHWPQVASVADRLAFVRSMTSKEGNHQRAQFLLHTGYAPAAGVRYPTLGAIAASEIPPVGRDLPSFVRIGGRGPGILGGGFLGVEHDPFVLRRAGAPPENVTGRVSSERLEARLGLLERLRRERGTRDPGSARDHRSLYGRAARLSLSERLDVFDLDREPAKIREAYGDTDFGRGCLLARRLVEAGTTFVEVELNGWDTHQDNFERVKSLSGQVDPAFASLVTDLDARGLLDTTLVVWMGEFGRTPRINPRTGRDHFPRAFNLAMAGAGVRGGQAIGATSDDGMGVIDRPVTPPDFFATVCRALGIDAAKENTANLGRPIKVVDDGAVVEELFG